jgi:hypothetical protein
MPCREDYRSMPYSYRHKSTRVQRCPAEQVRYRGFPEKGRLRSDVQCSWFSSCSSP